MPAHRHDFEARLRFLSPEEGGRQSPVLAGYRADFHYADDPTNQLWMIWPMEFITEEGEPLPPDTPISGTAYARMWIVDDTLRTHIHQARIHEGLMFQVQEGPHIVAEGVITKIVGLFDKVKPSAA